MYKKNIKKISSIFFILFLVPTVSYSSNGYKNNIETDTASQVNRNRDISKYNDYDEVVYEHLKLHDRDEVKISTAHQEKLNYDVVMQLKKEEIARKKEKLKNKMIQEKSIPKTVFLTGYCFGTNAIKVTRLSSYTYMKCNFENINGELAALLIPDAFSKALIGKPLYVKIKDKRFPVQGGVIMNYNKTTINLASVVNDRKVARWIATNAVEGGDIATKQALAYLKDRKAARTKEQTTYVNGSSSTPPQVVQSKTTQKPKVSDYLWSSAIQLVGNMIKSGGEIFTKDLPFMFKTKANAIYYVDLMVYDKNGILPKINISGDSLAIKSDAKNAEIPSKINFINGQQLKK